MAVGCRALRLKSQAAVPRCCSNRRCPDASLPAVTPGLSRCKALRKLGPTIEGRRRKLDGFFDGDVTSVFHPGKTRIRGSLEPAVWWLARGWGAEPRRSAAPQPGSPVMAAASATGVIQPSLECGRASL
jgi:hypothetical protein